MDFSQKKLTKYEWEAIEQPLPKNEIAILQMVHKAYANVHYSYNTNKSLIDVMKLTIDKKGLIHNFLFSLYFEQNIKKIIKTNNLTYKIKHFKTKDIAIKKADKIRIQNTETKMASFHHIIFEFELMKCVERFLQCKNKNETKSYYYYYTLFHISKCSILNVNAPLLEFIQHILNQYQDSMSVKKMVCMAYEFIEKNTILLKYSDEQLYEHQKELFTVVKSPGPKIILYQAPTGTGKTISPIGLACKHKVIFVCAAKHVGLQLAKACVNMSIPLAIAFGCNDPGDIRLHYNAAKDIVKNYKTGGIFRVDNTVGDKVEVIVCDVQSYLSAMNYMCAFNAPHDIITYWDEPTISLDYDDHEFHTILQKNWNDNIIPNMVLSSATLPNEQDILPVIQKFRSTFSGCTVYNIVSHDCKKTIPIIDVNGVVCLPHILYTTKEKLLACVRHCLSYKTLLRHFDIQEIIAFIRFVEKHKYITQDRYKLKHYFEEFEDITVVNIKLYYLALLKHLSKKWNVVAEAYKEKISPRLDSTICITTSDAHTLTDGPTIYIADDVELIAKYCLTLANIPLSSLETIKKNILYNQNIVNKISEIEKGLKQFTDKIEGDNKQCKDIDTGPSKTDSSVIRDFNSKINQYKSCIKSANLRNVYIPNTMEHVRKYAHSAVCTDNKSPFVCDIHDSVVEKIMTTSVATIWKMLLLLGIGVFTEFEDVTYLEIMKQLANEQKLFLIIASSDFIYGTNYQFCHGYIGKDIIQKMTQEKAIQAFGRIGRQNAQQDYSIRIRDNSLLEKVFQKQTNKREVVNMNRLFG